MTFLSAAEINMIGLRSVGPDVLISDRASFHGASRIDLGAFTRIDDFCVLSAGDGGIRVGRNVHIACQASLIGAEQIELADFANISSRVAVYSSSDDFTGSAMTGPTVPASYTNVTRLPVRVGRHVVIGTGSVVLPGVSIGDGSAIGALSLVDRDCAEFGIYAGVPVRFLKARKRDILSLERKYLAHVD